MLFNTKDLENCAIEATDGEIGHVRDQYFDDHAWVVRYLVVETGSWFSSRKVLVSPISIHHPDLLEKTLQVSITKEQVRSSPDIDADQPVSRQNEEHYMGYYGYSAYWGGPGMWGGGMYPYAMGPGYVGEGVDRVERDREMEAYLRAERARHRHDDPHLRSCNAVVGYHLHATDGAIGHVTGYLVDEKTWGIRYLVVDTSNWWMGHKVLIAPAWITGVHWSDKTVSANVTRESVKTAPVYDPDTAWTVDLDRDLHRHHGRESHWWDITPAVSWN